MEWKGNPVSQGIVLGKVFIYEPFQYQINTANIGVDEIAGQKEAYIKAKKGASLELRKIVDSMTVIGDDKAGIFIAHQEILDDEVMDEEIQDIIDEQRITADHAIEIVYEQYIKIIGAAKDDLIRERIADMDDVKLRLLRCLTGVEEKNLSNLSEPVVIVTRDLLPADTATLDRNNVLAIVTEIGGTTSHSAIIARSYEIPALLGVQNATDDLKNGELVIVDAVEGILVSEPAERQINHYTQKRDLFLKEREDTRKYLSAEPVTRDNKRIEVELNIGSANEKELESNVYVDGVGLFRTEFLYMGRDKLPTEDEQFEIYRAVLTAFGDKPVTLRTLDIGGDKKLDCMDLPKEENPFLGNRALRLCLSHPDIFKTQLRAVLRASVYGNLWIMFPMVSSMEDIMEAKNALEETKRELFAQGLPFSDTIKVGIMIEIPSIALVSDQAAREVDFASIGSNDLCQYLTATDRMNPKVAQYYRSFHPAMFRLIGMVVKAFTAQGKEVAVCGEMGGNPVSALALMGLGVNRLSMGLASVPQVKKMIVSSSYEDAAELAERIQHCIYADEVQALLNKYLINKTLDKK